MIAATEWPTVRRPVSGFNAERTMERLLELLNRVREKKLVSGRFRGLVHVAIGRTIKADDGSVVSSGTTWRELSHLLKAAKYDKEIVRELGADPDQISPRDRERFWYSAIAVARPDSAEALAEADLLIEQLAPLGYTVGPPPPSLSGSTKPVEASKSKEDTSKGTRSAKKGT
jgi:hypothetical protein